MSDTYYIVAGCRPWNRTTFDEQISKLDGVWKFAANEWELADLIAKHPSPRYIFFLHWSSMVPDEWLEHHECVCFHMSDLPYGRGGSPLQNLIQNGWRETKLSAFRMVGELDAGPVYCKAGLSLEGGAEEIYLRADGVSAQLVKRIISEHPMPVNQAGIPVKFRRRKPAESLLPESATGLVSLYDFIRMLDAEEYPRAFIEREGFRFEFSRAALYHERIEADVRITRISK